VIAVEPDRIAAHAEVVTHVADGKLVLAQQFRRSTIEAIVSPGDEGRSRRPTSSRSADPRARWAHSSSKLSTLSTSMSACERVRRIRARKRASESARST